MADIEPYKQIQKTNIQEHNDLVAKINEIVDVINNTNLDTVVPKISKLEQDVSAINATDALQWNDIELIKTKNTEQDSTLATHATEIDGVTKSLVSDVVIMNGTTVGNMKVRIARKDAPSIDSDDYNIQKPTSVELVQGSAPAMVKAQITLSDGTVLISDDFMFTTEAIGQDVYISSFVFKNGNVAGTISADIGLSNGSTLTANNFVVPTDPNVTSVISDLQTRMTAVEGGLVGGLDGLKATVDGHTASINALDSDVANLMTDKVDVAQGIGNAGKVLGINDLGNVEPVTVSSGAEEWEVIDLNNWPTDWVDGDKVRITLNKIAGSTIEVSDWTSTIAGAGFITLTEKDIVSTMEFTITNNGYDPYKVVQSNVENSSSGAYTCKAESILTHVFTVSQWISGSYLFNLMAFVYNGVSCKRSNNVTFDTTNLNQIATKIERVKH